MERLYVDRGKDKAEGWEGGNLLYKDGLGQRDCGLYIERTGTGGQALTMVTRTLDYVERVWTGKGRVGGEVGRETCCGRGPAQGTAGFIWRGQGQGYLNVFH